MEAQNAKKNNTQGKKQKNLKRLAHQNNGGAKTLGLKKKKEGQKIKLPLA
ncbi:uncharacterized protein G2W53_001053 [Senna tora]|uniref:Uncharacterized protein n=1 Tax=Senna tora TaxID=362788 RepID=A0A834XF66_9FABA|nr:uncharacterized protein G2W53_001053 [Senna tora]